MADDKASDLDTQDQSSWVRDIRLAASFLLALPIPVLAAGWEKPNNTVMRAFPFIGLAVTGAAWLALAITGWLGLPASVMAVAALVAMTMISGAIHEDGLADSMDAIWAPDPGADRLAILHDDRTGVMAILGLIIIWLVNVGLLVYAIEAGYGYGACAAAACGSRAAMIGFAWFLPVIEGSRLAKTFDTPDDRTLLEGIIIGVALVILFLEGVGIIAVLLAGLATVGWCWLCRRHFGGYNGDLCGALQQIVQMLILLSATLSL